MSQATKMKILTKLTNMESALISGGVCLCICKDRKSIHIISQDNYEIVENPGEDYRVGITTNKSICSNTCESDFNYSECKESDTGYSSSEGSSLSEISDNSVSRISSMLSSTSFGSLLFFK